MDLAEILANHNLWLEGKCGGKGGKRADLTRVNLSGANLSGENLSRVILSGADLSDADLYGADLSGTRLSGANLFYCKGIVDCGHDARGYRFWAWKDSDGRIVYRAGCREWRDINEAINHYTDRYDSDGDPEECVARLRVLHFAAKHL